MSSRVAIIDALAWQDEAACARMPAELFDVAVTPGGGVNPWPAEGLAACAGCPVTAACRVWMRPGRNGFTGVCAGDVWVNGRRATPPRRRVAFAPQPCGTHSAYNRHRGRGESPCADCRAGEAAYQARRKRQRRTA